MIEDIGLNKLEKELYAYIKETSYEIISKPYSTNMTLDRNGILVSLPEFIVSATVKRPDGTIISCKLSPSKKAIYFDGELVKNLG